MKRFAVAAVVIVLSAMKADAQFINAGPLYGSTSSAPNAIGRYYPVSGTGFYMQQPSGFGIVNWAAGTIPPTYYPSGGIILSNPVAPNLLYNDAIFNGIYSNPVNNSSLYYPYSYFPYAYRPGLVYR